MQQHLYFIGIAGHAMRGLALAAQNNGHMVSGLDEGAVPPGSDWLDEHHLTWTREYNPAQLDGVTTVIVSGGTAADHPAVLEAEQRQLPIQSFAAFLGELTQGKHVISVAGTHGKTTTSAFITWLLEAAGRKPDFLIGIQPFNFDSSARLDGSDVVVVEGDEYKASNLEDRSKLEYYHPDVMVLTAVEHDHPDVFADLDAVIERFRRVIQRMPASGQLIVWGENQAVLTVADGAPCPVVTYGLEAGDYRARDIAYLPAGIEFDIETPDGILGRLAVPIYGKHNVLNALAAAAVALREGLTFEQIVSGAGGFKGAYRRFNILTSPDAPITVIDDYAHHPTEVATTIEAAKLHFGSRRLVVVFRPHTYSRTKALLKEYHQAFSQADVVYVTDIEGAREKGQVTDISGADIVEGLTMPATYETDRAHLVERVLEQAQPGDVVLCMTVSGYDDIAGELVRELNKS